MSRVTGLARRTDHEADARAALAADVRRYLEATPRQLPSRALYDPLGSALFDAICQLPWYPVTRAERGLLATHRADILRLAGAPPLVVELGPGNGEKLELLLRAGVLPPSGRRDVHLVDVSALALQNAAHRLSEVPGVRTLSHQRTYEAGLVDAVRHRAASDQALVLFLGSNIGNFDPAGARRFLHEARAALRVGDVMLIGADLVKPERELQLAYDDPLGVTAAFNKNLLVHLNRELDATFDITRFAHRAVWNAEASRVEMHLVSLVAQSIDVPAAGVSFDMAPGETIWTESSYKYEVGAFEGALAEAGFDAVHRWVADPGRFMLVMARAR
ncbi:MAG: L-histidine N(alpha)-methyltransferase [Vicinamibacterales bacterium]